MLYDIGANVGAYSLYAAKHHRGAVKVYAFEPAAPTIPLLIHNIIRNGCTGTVVPMTFPLSAKPTLATFNYHTNLTPGLCACTRLAKPSTTRAKRFSRCSRSFWFRRRSINWSMSITLQPPNHIKIDVDGLEFEILSGGAEVLRSGAVESLFFEVGGRFDMTVVIPFLESCGFQATSRPSSTTTPTTCCSSERTLLR